MNGMSANQEEIDMKLTQLGAKVTSLHGIISFIHFYFGQTELSYVYNINVKDKFFLQMVKPYPLAAGVFSNSQEMVQYIKNDIRQFQNASKSNVFNEFITVNKNLCESVQTIKDVFMSYNIPKDKMKQVREKADELSGLLREIKKTSPSL
jgi:hypothetical protein